MSNVPNIFDTGTKIKAAPTNQNFAYVQNEIDVINAVLEASNPGANFKANVVVATTANITLSGLLTIDTITLNDGDRVLVKNQTLAQFNGIYNAHSSSWIRSTDLNIWAESVSATVYAAQGSINLGSQFACVSTLSGTIDITPMNWIPYGSIGGFAPLNSPAFIGNPTAPTAAVGANTTQLATTAFVHTAITSSNQIGVTPYPKVLNSFTTTGTFSFNSTTVTGVASNLANNGDAVVATGFPTGTYIVSGGGTSTWTISNKTTFAGTNTAIIVGDDRWELGSYFTANSLASKTLFVGQTAVGRSTPMQQIGASGLDFPNVCCAAIMNPYGAVSLAIVGQASLNSIPSYDATECLVILNLIDAPRAVGTWNEYTEARILTSSVGGGIHLNKESSILQYTSTVDTDPFNINAAGSTRHTRYDFGLGTNSIGVGNNGSCFIDMANNNQTARIGIVVGSTSLDTSGGRIAPFVALAPNHSLTWYSSTNIRSWDIYSAVTSGNPRSLILGDNGLQISREAGTLRSIDYMTSKVLRITAGLTTTAESGSNAGADYGIATFNDSGAFILTASLWRRSNGELTHFSYFTTPLIATLNFANDAAAAAGGVPLYSEYHNAGAKRIRLI